MKTLSFVTRDLDAARKLGDQGSVMAAGRIVQTETGGDSVARRATRHVAGFLAHANPRKLAAQ